MRNACKCILEQVPCQHTYYTLITFHHTTFDEFAYACQRGGRGGLAAEARAIYDGFRCQDFSVGYLFNQTIAFFNDPSRACEAYRITDLDGGSNRLSLNRFSRGKTSLNTALKRIRARRLNRGKARHMADQRELIGLSKSFPDG